MRVQTLVGLLVLGGSLFLIPAGAGAQQANSTIAGRVQDASAGALPGVTVEAASPALIEQARVVVTNGQGQYSIVALPPGTYSVTFTLPGFSQFRREEILLTGGFTATVNAEMTIGGIEETITVSGESPVVDTQSVRNQAVVSDELMTSLPSGLKAYTSIARLIPGMNVGSDAGGANGLFMSFFVSRWTRHGVGGARILVDGMSMQNVTGSSRNTSPINSALVNETIVEQGGVSAESNSNGLTFNMIPKEGSNAWNFSTFGTFTGSALQADNLPPELVDLGIPATETIKSMYDVHFTVGGPIKRDRLWIFSATRATGLKTLINGLFENATIGTPFYTASDRPAERREWDNNSSARITWQVSPRNKFSGLAFFQTFQQRGGTTRQAQEASTSFGTAKQGFFWPAGMFQAAWTAPLTSRLLIEMGASITTSGYPMSRKNIQEDLGILIDPLTHIAMRELSTGFRYNAKGGYHEYNLQDRYAERFTVSYVTGSHTFKTGLQMEQTVVDRNLVYNQDQQWFLNRGVPSSIEQRATPYQRGYGYREIGMFAQDQWTIDRLTLTYGLRFDYFQGHTRAEDGTLDRLNDSLGNPIAPGLFIGPRSFEALNDVPNFKDVSPRLGASYDLFGDGRTAIKAYFGRYLGKSSIQIPETLLPNATSINNVTRSWSDTNGNIFPDCDLTNFTSNGECGPISNVNFGGQNPNAQQFTDDLISGFGNRDYFWDTALEVQQQLREGMSFTVGYYRNWSDHYGSINEGWPTGHANNLAVTSVDFDPYCVIAPLDQGLPGGGGYEVCGLYDVSPAKFGQGNVLTERASLHGGKRRTSDFVTVSLNGRLTGGGVIGGSFDTGRTVQDQCFVIDSPQELLHCRQVTPFGNQTQIKLHGTYPLPGGFDVSAVLQNVSGVEYEADWRAPNDMIAPSLGRNLAACGTGGGACSASVVVPLLAPHEQSEGRRTVLDVQASKLVSVGASRLRLNLEVFNVLNRSDLVTVNNNFGSQWRLPTPGSSSQLGMLGGRTIQFGAQMDF